MKITLSSSNANMGCLARTLVLMVGVLVSAVLLPGVHVHSVFAAFVTAMVIAFLDNLVRPILQIVAFPFVVVTMGLFLFVINAVVILMADGIVREGFELDSPGTLWAVLMSLIITGVNYLLEWLNKRSRQQPYQDPSRPSRQDDNHFDDYEEIK